MEKIEWNSETIRQLRKDMNLTQTAFADKLGCRQQTVSEWEMQDHEPSRAYKTILNMFYQGKMN